jgi:hypothetical protein
VPIIDSMNVAAPTQPVISEPLTWEQICARYPDEWVSLVEFAWVDETVGEYTTARVAGHHKTRKEAYELTRALRERYDEIGRFWTGVIRAPFPPCWKFL